MVAGLSVAVKLPRRRSGHDRLGFDFHFIAADQVGDLDQGIGGADMTAITATSCDQSDVGIFVQDLTGADGCDSVVVTTVSLLASDTTAVFGTSCDLNDVGVFEQLLIKLFYSFFRSFTVIDFNLQILIDGN